MINSNKLPELHLRGYEFCGPGTRLLERLSKGQRGVNSLDRGCLHHDLGYFLTQDIKSRHHFDKDLQDRAFSIMSDPNTKLQDKINAGLVGAIMYSKRKLGLGKLK